MEAYQPAISFHSSGQYEIAVAAMATGEVNKGFGSRRERGGQKQKTSRIKRWRLQLT